MYLIVHVHVHAYKSAMYNHVPLKIKRSSLEIVLLFYKLLLRCLACRIKTKLKNVKVFYVKFGNLLSAYRNTQQERTPADRVWRPGSKAAVADVGKV